MPQRKKYAKPEEFSKEARKSLDFDSQYTEGDNKQLRITRTCLGCGDKKRLSVSSIRTDRHKFTGICNICAGKAKLSGVTGGSHPAWQGGITLRNATIRSMQRAAIKRGYSWGITHEQCADIMQGDCFYCGSTPNNTRSDPSYKGKTNTEYLYNGIDRIDNNIGYELSNIVPCCFYCNRAKGEISVSEWLLHMENIIAQKQRILKAVANG